MKFNRIAAGIVAGAVLSGLTGIYPYAVTNYAIAADDNCDNTIDSSDASSILAFYANISIGGTETDMGKWLSTET